MHKIIFVIAIFFCSAYQSVFANQGPQLDLSHLTQKQTPKAVWVSVADPVYKTQKKYHAYPLADLVKQLKIPDDSSKNDLLIVFTALDGYKAYLNYALAMSEPGYLAFHDSAAPAGKNWVAFKFGKELVTPAPFYLVWPNTKLNKWQYPWPFQVASIALQPRQDYFAASAPKNSSAAVQAGFDLFSRYCIRCHTINHSGGTLATELNVPVNVTERYDAKYLSQFIHDAPHYQPETKMPSFKNTLNKTQIQQLLDYLEHMRSEKVD